MTPFARLVVAVDGSPASDAAARFSIALARHHGAALRFVAVVDLPRLLTETSGASLAALGASEELEVEGLVAEGDPVDEILAYAGKWNASCIVMGTHGRTGLARAILSSRTEGVLRRSDVPVLVVHEATPVERVARLASILCALDDAPPSRAAFEAALAIARERRATLALLAIVTLDDTIDDARRRLAPFAGQARTAGVEVAVDVAGGHDVAAAIVARANERNVDLIAIGTHGRHGIERALLGSVAETVIRTSEIPVLATRESG